MILRKLLDTWQLQDKWKLMTNAGDRITMLNEIRPVVNIGKESDSYFSINQNAAGSTNIFVSVFKFAYVIRRIQLYGTSATTGGSVSAELLNVSGTVKITLHTIIVAVGDIINYEFRYDDGELIMKPGEMIRITTTGVGAGSVHYIATGGYRIEA
jgi:hypothetical protein